MGGIPTTLELYTAPPGGGADGLGNTRPEAQQSATNQIWAMAAMFGGFGVIMLFMVMTVQSVDIFQRAVLYFMVVLLFLGFATSLIVIYRIGGDERTGESVGPYSCKHCGRGFSSKRVHKSHERSCLEMKVW